MTLNCSYCGRFIDGQPHYTNRKPYCGRRCQEFAALIAASRLQSHWLLVPVWVLLLLMGEMIFSYKPAKAHDMYRHFLQPGTNQSCCDERRDAGGAIVGDCFKTTARIVNGTWVALIPFEGREIVIPDSKVLHERNPHGEYSMLCYNPYSKEVLCFIPEDSGS